VQVHYDEGVAIHIGPEPCVGVRKDGDEASVGEGIGQPLSRESQSPGADAVSSAEGNTSRTHHCRPLSIHVCCSDGTMRGARIAVPFTMA
jgi:hypothetical protein